MIMFKEPLNIVKVISANSPNQKTEDSDGLIEMTETLKKSIEPWI